MSKARLIITAVVLEGRSLTGNVSLRINGQLHHIDAGRTFDRTPVILLIDHLDVRIIHAATR